MEYRDYYQILGVKRAATADEIKSSYRRLARKYHPDVSKEANAEEHFKEVQEAYEVLRDAEKRAAYDQLGSDWKSGQPFRPPPDWGSGFEFDGGAPGARPISWRCPGGRLRRAGLQRVFLLAVWRRLAVRRGYPARRTRPPRAHRSRPRAGVPWRNLDTRAQASGTEE